MSRRQIGDILDFEKAKWVKKNYNEWLEYFGDEWSKSLKKGTGEEEYWLQIQLLVLEESWLQIQILVIYDLPGRDGSINNTVGHMIIVHKDGRVEA